MTTISQTTISNAFSWMKMLGFRLKFYWSFFPRVELKIFHHWFWWWLGANQATSHYLNRWWLDHRRKYASLGLNELKNTYHWNSNIPNILCCLVIYYIPVNNQAKGWLIINDYIKYNDISIILYHLSIKMLLKLCKPQDNSPITVTSHERHVVKNHG